MLNSLAMLRRLLSIVFTALLSLCFIYLVLSILPGDSTTYMSGESVIASSEKISLAAFLFNAITLNLNDSAFLSIPVRELIFSRMVPTLILTILSLFFAILIALLMVYLDQKKGKKLLLELYCSIIYSLPSFFIAILFLFVVAKVFNYFISYDDSNKIISLIIPSLSLGIVHSAFLMKNLKDLLEREKIKQYVIVAYSKGLSDSRVFFFHIFINILHIVIVLINQSFISLFSSSAAVELIFSIPGIGNLIVNAINRRDSNTIAGVIIIVIMLTSLLSVFEDIIAAIKKRRGV